VTFLRLLPAVVALIAATATASTPLPPLTPNGWGKLRIGMRERDAVRLFHIRVAADDETNSFDCRQEDLPGHPGVSVMAESGVITNISVEAPSRLRTERGFGVGSREADIRRAYGPALKVETAEYAEEPAHDLTFWASGQKQDRRGVRYGTDARGRVTWFAVGGPSISYMEGCI
jgi:hypothetical protein